MGPRSDAAPPKNRLLLSRPVLIIAAAIVLLPLISWAMREAPWSDGAGQAGGQVLLVVKTALIPLIHAINNPAFVYLTASLIVLSAVVVVVLYRQRVVMPQLDALSSAEYAVNSLPQPKAGDWRATLTDVGAMLSRYDVMSSTWPIYAQEAADLGGLPPRRFAYYAESDPSSEWNRQGSLMNSLPAYYTTIGLILTFVGLVVALYFAGRGFRSGDMGEARQAIVELLNASAFKFLSSVAALFSAFMVSIAHRIGQSRLRHQTKRVLSAIDNHLQAARLAAPPPAAPDHQLAAKLDQMIAELVATRKALEALIPAAAQER